MLLKLLAIGFDSKRDKNSLVYEERDMECLSTDQRLLLEYMLRVSTGTMNNKFMKKKIG